MKRYADDTDDASLVVSLKVGRYIVNRIVVDTGSVANILFWDAVAQMGIPDTNILPCVLPLIRLTRRSINSSGIVSLPMYFNGTT